MNSQLNRKRRKAIQAKASVAFGMKGDDAVTMRDAYQAIVDRLPSQAVQLALKVSKTSPNNVHPWLVLGAVALERREVETAHVFFDTALKLDPKNTIALASKGKTHLISAEVNAAVRFFETAIIAGSKDLSMVRIYADISARLGLFSATADHLEIVAKRLSSHELWNECGENHISAEQYVPAAVAFENALALEPNNRTNKIARAKALIFRHEYHSANEWLDEIIVEFADDDELPTLKMIALRNLGRWEEALSFLDFQYVKPVHYQRALAQAAYIYMDQGNSDMAGKCLRQSINVDGEGKASAQKSLASYLFLNGEFERGAEFYKARSGSLNNSTQQKSDLSPTDLQGQQKLFIRAEQGVGDQLALLPLINQLGNFSVESPALFVGPERMRPIIECAAPRIDFFPEDAFTGTRSEQSYPLGDFIGLLGPTPNEGRKFGGYINLPIEKVDIVKQRYARASGGRPVIGLAWRSAESLTGHHRSLRLARLVEILPENAFVVNLQYGNCRDEIQKVKRIRSDVTFFDDTKIDQMKDLMGFLTQIAAVGCVVTIDNTTAHACGAIGHPNTHVLIPSGAECMWYWGTSGTIDPWYSVLNLYRQKKAQNWDFPLGRLQQVLAVKSPVLAY